MQDLKADNVIYSYPKEVEDHLKHQEVIGAIIRSRAITQCVKVVEDILRENINNADCYKMGWEIVNSINALQKKEK